LLFYSRAIQQNAQCLKLIKEAQALVSHIL